MKFAKISVLLVLSLASCAKPPVYKGPSGGAGTGDGGGGKPPGGGPGGTGPGGTKTDPVVGTIPTDKFLGLTCMSKTDPKGFRAWRRLSNKEYKNTIVDLFGKEVEGEVKGMIDDINRHDIYDTLVTPVNYVDVQRMRNYRDIAKAVVNKVDINKVFPCLKEGEGCISKTIPDYGAKVWRRPLTPEETGKITALFKATTGEGVNAEAGAKLVLQALLSSHNFIYRTEMGTTAANGSYTLTPWEVASAISYTILRMPPDDKLRQAAKDNKLATIDGIKAEATRLFADARAKDAWKDFANMWLDSRSITEATKNVKEFDDGLKSRSSTEVGDLFSDVINRPTGSTLEALMTADSVPAPNGNNFVYDTMAANGRITFKENERRGIFGQTSFLAAHSNVEETSPVKRGAFIIERMLCTGFPPVPVFELPKKKEGQSNKDRFADIAKNPGCGSCHNTIQSFGNVFENFDQIGRFRTEADGQKVDAASEVTIDGEKHKVSGPAELSGVIAKSKQGRECFARHIFRYGAGRSEFAPLPLVAGDGKPIDVTVQGDADSCQIKSIADKMEEAGGDMKSAIISFLTSPGFLQRVDRVDVKAPDEK